MMSRFINVKKNFYSRSRQLRRVFDERFQNPLQDHAARYVWDYWHVPDQYTHLRTPASSYFPKNLTIDFLTKLTRWGQENLGCHAISPPWLSCYIEGCEQKLHRDVPHGPFAFVYSLSARFARDFSGGRTMIMKPQSHGLEMQDQFHFIEPTFNQLLVFDPRFLHGVERVNGTQDPRLGRLVVHGWFTEPQPWAEGPLSRGGGFDPLYEWLENAQSHVPEIEDSTGLLLFDLSVSPSGQVRQLKLKQNTLYQEGLTDTSANSVARAFAKEIKKIRFAKKSQSSRLVLPLIYS